MTKQKYCNLIGKQVAEINKEIEQVKKYLIHLEEVKDSLMEESRSEQCEIVEDLSPEAVEKNKKLADELKKEWEN